MGYKAMSLCVCTCMHTHKHNECLHVTHTKICVRCVHTALRFGSRSTDKFWQWFLAFTKIRWHRCLPSCCYWKIRWHRCLPSCCYWKMRRRKTSWYWLLQLLQQPWREKDGTGGGCTPSFKTKGTRSIPPSCPWTGTRWCWQLSSLFLTDKRNSMRRFCTHWTCMCPQTEILCTGLLQGAKIIFMHMHTDTWNRA